MSTPDSAQSLVLLPAVPRLRLVPDAVAALPAIVVAAGGLVAIQTVAFFAGRVLAASLSTLHYIDTTSTATALGAVSFMSIVLIAGTIALGRRAYRSTDGVARLVSAVVLGAASLHLVLWVTRVVAAAMAVSGEGSGSLFLPGIFWWG